MRVLGLGVRGEGLGLGVWAEGPRHAVRAKLLLGIDLYIMAAFHYYRHLSCAQVRLPF